MLNKILGLVFGKSPDIFDQDGNVVHKFPESKWAAWNNRFHNNEYNWRDHRGTKRKAGKPDPVAKSNLPK